MNGENPFFDDLGEDADKLLEVPVSTRAETWPVVGGVAAGEVLERDSTTGDPNVWETAGGSLYGRDSTGKPVKLRGKWD